MTLDDHLVQSVTDFDLGDTVVTKRIGLPAMGQVIGAVTGPLWATQNNFYLLSDKDQDPPSYLCVNAAGNIQFTNWNTKYPNWVLKPVIVVKFSEIQTTLSFEEFKAFRKWDEAISDEGIKACYDLECPKSNIIAYPEDDLEKYE